MARRPRPEPLQGDLFAGLANPGSSPVQKTSEGSGAPPDGSLPDLVTLAGGGSGEPAPSGDPELARVLARLDAAVTALRARGVEISPGQWGVSMHGGRWVLEGKQCCPFGAMMAHEEVRVSRHARDGRGYVVSSVRADAARALGVEFEKLDSLIVGFDGATSAGRVLEWERAGAELRARVAP